MRSCRRALPPRLLCARACSTRLGSRLLHRPARLRGVRAQRVTGSASPRWTDGLSGFLRSDAARRPFLAALCSTASAALGGRRAAAAAGSCPDVISAAALCSLFLSLSDRGFSCSSVLHRFFTPLLLLPFSAHPPCLPRRLPPLLPPCSSASRSPRKLLAASCRQHRAVASSNPSFPRALGRTLRGWGRGS